MVVFRDEEKILLKSKNENSSSFISQPFCARTSEFGPKGDILLDGSTRVSFYLFSVNPVDELGEIAVTDKQILLFLAMDGYAVKQIYSYYLFFLLLLFSLLFRVWTCCRSGCGSGQSHVIFISAR